MKRLTDKDVCIIGERGGKTIYTRLWTIENILGNDYDLDQLRQALQKQAEYTEFMERWKDAVAIAGAVKEVGADRLAELAEADKAGRLYKFRFGVGSTVYRTYIMADESRSFISEDKIKNVYDAIRAETLIDTYGTRKEAEAALEKMKEAQA